MLSGKALKDKQSESAWAAYYDNSKGEPMSISKRLLDDLSRTEPSEFEEERVKYGTFPATRV